MVHHLVRHGEGAQGAGAVVHVHNGQRVGGRKPGCSKLGLQGAEPDYGLAAPTLSLVLT